MELADDDRDPAEVLADLRERLDKAQARLEVAERVALSMTSHVGEECSNQLMSKLPIAMRKSAIDETVRREHWS